MAQRARDRASEHIEKTITEQKKRGLQAMPTVAQLAQAAGVSHVTVLRALERFKADGRLSAGRGRKLTIAGAARDSARTGGLRPGLKCAELVDRLVADIARQKFGRSAVLPSPKQLCLTYDVSYRTLRKAFSALATKGVLVRYKRTYRVVDSSVTRTNAAVILAVQGQDLGRPILPAPHHVAFVTTLEGFLREHNVQLRIRAFNTTKTKSVVWNKLNEAMYGTPEKNLAILGGIIWHAFDTTSVVPSRCWRALFPRQATLVHLVQASRRGDRPRHSPTDRAACTLRFADEYRAGYEVARFLLNRGHRSIAFFSPFHAHEWSRVRLDGMEDACREFGSDHLLRAYTSDDIDRIEASLPGFPARAKEGHPPWHELMRTAAGPAFSERALDSIRILIGSQLRDWGQKAFSSCITANFAALKLVASAKDDGSTAWVAVNDEIGLGLLRYLRAAEIPVPSTLSVLGFDDTFESCRDSLTSYNFGTQNAARIAAGHILGLPAARELTRNGDVTCSGAVSERYSTQQALTRTEAARAAHADAVFTRTRRA